MDFIECGGMLYPFPSNEPTDDIDETECDSELSSGFEFDPTIESREF